MQQIYHYYRFSPPEKRTSLSEKRGSPTCRSSQSSSNNNTASFSISIEGEMTEKHNEDNIIAKPQGSAQLLDVEKVADDMNEILMNPLKKIRKNYSVSILNIDQKVVERGFITEYYDCGFNYAIHPTIAMHTSKPSKINAALKDMNTKIKKLCHRKVEDRPLDDSHPLYNIPIWPHMSDKPDTSSAEWEHWNRSRVDIADNIVKALQSAYVTKTSFKGTISAIYNKLTNKSANQFH